MKKKSKTATNKFPATEIAISRRHFLEASAAGLITISSGLRPKSYNRIIGANDRVNIGFLGNGTRGMGHIRMVKNSAGKKNLDVVAVCDIWDYNRKKASAYCSELFNSNVREYKYSEDLLRLKDLDAVMIATGDHQHAKILAEVVKAGKDCYCEKPMAQDEEEASLARNTVLGTDQIVQMGSQWLSEPVQIRIRDMVRSGKLGKITKIEQCWNDNNHRWHDPNDPDIARIREEDTDWERWLLGKPFEPFDPVKYFEFRIFKKYSGGITSQWMSHGIGLVHFYTDTAIPDSIVASGGIYGWPDKRENPDTFQALATYGQEGFLYSYSSSYANKFGDHTIIRGKEGTLFSHGGEGSPRWFFIPEHLDLPAGFDFYKGIENAVQSGIAGMVTPEGDMGILPPTQLSDDTSAHLENWIDCIRSRNRMTNGHIMTGYWHSIGIIMATRAYRENSKIYWDRETERITDIIPGK
jgi:predicted dehydrogenase